MSWLARLKKVQAPESDATKATEGVEADFCRFRSVSAVGIRNNTPPNDPAPESGTWPRGDAWNAQEIDRFEARLALLTDQGLNLGEAEELAEMLVQRDRDQDERRLCLECVHYRRGRCSNWQAAGVPQELGELTNKLQRCPGFAPAIAPSPNNGREHD